MYYIVKQPIPVIERKANSTLQCVALSPVRYCTNMNGDTVGDNFYAWLI